jgi:hypothetical protein
VILGRQELCSGLENNINKINCIFNENQEIKAIKKKKSDSPG